MKKIKQSFLVLGIGVALALMMLGTSIGAWGMDSLAYAFYIFAVTMALSVFMFFSVFFDQKTEKIPKRIAFIMTIISVVGVFICMVIVSLLFGRI